MRLLKKFLNYGVTISKKQMLNWLDENCTLSLQKISDRICDNFHICISKPTVMKILKQFYYSLKRIQYIPERRNTQWTIDIQKKYTIQFDRLPMLTQNIIFIHEMASMPWNKNVIICYLSQAKAYTVGGHHIRTSDIFLRNHLLISYKH